LAVQYDYDRKQRRLSQS